MKTLELNKYGVQEMNAGEMRETEGGFWGIMDILFKTEWCGFDGAGWGPAFNYA